MTLPLAALHRRSFRVFGRIRFAVIVPESVLKGVLPTVLGSAEAM